MICKGCENEGSDVLGGRKRVCHLSEGQNSALFNERRLFINAEFVQDI